MKDHTPQVNTQKETLTTRQEITEYLGISTVSHAIKHHVMPLVEEGQIHLLYPESPRSRKQKYYSNPTK